MIKLIGFNGPIQIPGRVSVLSTWNVTEHGRTLRVEETPEGVRFRVGLIEGEAWKPTGDVVDVGKHKIDYIIRTEGASGATKEQKK